MSEDSMEKFDLSIPRRMYYSKDCGLTSCPECGMPLIEHSCAIMLAARSDIEEAEFVTNMGGSRFCRICPVIVLDTIKVKQAAQINLRSNGNLEYAVPGIVNMDAIPEEKSHLPLGTDENPFPLVKFLPNKPEKALRHKKVGRNDTCPCGSGKKYKKCCG